MGLRLVDRRLGHGPAVSVKVEKQVLMVSVRFHPSALVSGSTGGWRGWFGEERRPTMSTPAASVCRSRGRARVANYATLAQVLILFQKGR